MSFEYEDKLDKIYVEIGGDTKPYEFSRAGLDTYEDLRKKVEAVMENSTEGFVFDDDYGAELKFESEISKNIKRVRLVPQVLELELVHNGYKETILINRYKTSRDLKAEFTVLTGVTIPGELSFLGKKVSDVQPLSRIQNLANSSILSGLVRIIIKDEEVDNEVTLEINDYLTLNQLLDRYSFVEKRKIFESAQLHKSDDRARNESEPLDRTKTLYEHRLFHDTSLSLITQSYPVELVEFNRDTSVGSSHPPKVLLQVFDFWTINRVKEEYNLQVGKTDGPKEVLTKNDKLVSKREELADDLPLYKLSIVPAREGSNAPISLTIQREDVTMQSHEYTCADCGNDVRLKKIDHVRCMICGHRVLYKRRTPKPCQYDCR